MAGCEDFSGLERAKRISAALVVMKILIPHDPPSTPPQWKLVLLRTEQLKV